MRFRFNTKCLAISAGVIAITACKTSSKSDLSEISVKVDHVAETRKVCNFASIQDTGHGLGETEEVTHGFSSFLKDKEVIEVCKASKDNLSIFTLTLTDTVGYSSPFDREGFREQFDLFLTFLIGSELKAEAAINSRYLGQLYARDPEQAKRLFSQYIDALGQMAPLIKRISDVRKSGFDVQIGDETCSRNGFAYDLQALIKAPNAWRLAVAQMEHDLKKIPKDTKTLLTFFTPDSSYFFPASSKCISDSNSAYGATASYEISLDGFFNPTK